MATLQTTSAPSVKLDQILSSSGDPAIKTGQLDSDSRYLRKAKVVATTTGFTCTTAWITDVNLSELLTDFLPGSLIRLYYHVPARNPSTSWGGLYIEPQVEFNESGTWNSLGCSGYDGGVMQLNHSSIASYTNTILINPSMAAAFSAKFRFRFRSYDGTCGINETGGTYNMNLNVVSDTAAVATGTNGLQHYYHIIVEEYALWSTPPA